MTETHRDLLLEIGLEEMPALYCSPGLVQLQDKARSALAAARLRHEAIEVFGTPRRLTLLVKTLALRQEDREVVARGPARKAAFDAEGRPTKAAEGFARGQGVAVGALTVESDDKGNEYVYARRREEGQSVAVVLPPLLEKLILGLEWPKSMRWGDGSARFARPIRWIVALLGRSPVPFSVDGLAAGRTTRGHRTLGPADSLEIADPPDYFIKLGRGFVLVDHHQRRNIIWHQVQQEAAALNGYVPPDEDLLEEVTWLVEQPFAFHGQFDPAYLEVPAQVLVTSMREHQRYFPVYDRPGGNLLPYFIAVRNGMDANLDVVRAGNQKVLRARLADARFFFQEDRRQRLEERVPRLAGITFQEKLGTMQAKAERLERLTGTIGQALALTGAQLAQALRAARLAKADLVTHMVYEFTELQGIMGREYALREGEDPAVAAAIAEHYQPRFSGDELPASLPGLAVALADRLDTLAGFFGIGLIPTGSADPYALRRAAQGAVAIVVEKGLPVSLGGLLEAALAQYPQLDATARQSAHNALLDFFRGRIKGILEERGHRYDVIEAVLAAGFDQPVDVLKRAEALSALLPDAAFAAVLSAFKRVANLAAKGAELGLVPSYLESGAQLPAIRPELLQEPAERALWSAVGDWEAGAKASLAKGDYAGLYQHATRLKAPVDGFLDQVLVMADDAAVRQNRLALLARLARVLSGPADLGRLSGEL